MGIFAGGIVGLGGAGIAGGAPATSGVNSINGVQGNTQLISITDGIVIETSGQCILISGLFTAASGAVLEQKCDDIVILSGLIGDTQTSINGLSGTVNLVSPNDGIVIEVQGQDIIISGLFTGASGAILEQKCEDILTLSGLIQEDTDTQTSINGLSGVVEITSANDGISVSTSGQSIILSGLFTGASGAILEQKCDDIATLSGLIDDIDEESTPTISGIVQSSGLACYTSTGSSDTFGTTFTAVRFPSTIVEDSPFYAITAGSTRLNFKIDGLYKISYSLQLATNCFSSDMRVESRVLQNATTIITQGNGREFLTSDPEGNACIANTFLVALSAGDFLEIQTALTVGGEEAQRTLGTTVVIEYMRRFA